MLILRLLTLSFIALGSPSPFLPSAAWAGGLDPRPASDLDLRHTWAAGSEAAVKQLQEQGSMTSLVAAVEATRYGVNSTKPGGYKAANPAQHFWASFGASGVEVRPSGEPAGWQLGLGLRAWGYGERLKPPGGAVIGAAANRVEYHYRAGGSTRALTEWYVNTARGIEQGFTLARPPAGARRGVPLTLVVAVRGELVPRLAARGQAIEFAGADGRAVLRYAGLRVWDAGGRTLSSRLEVGAGQLRLLVDDTSAVYPVTVDPLIYSEIKLTASDGVAGNLFGFSVAISEDTNTVVVGADQELASGAAGKAYIYVRSGTTWSEQAKLTPSDGAAGDQFGFFLAISGNAVVVGAPGHASLAGKAYVYARNGTTWSEQAKLAASDGAAGDQFGWFVGISGDTVVVGAPSHQTNTGQAYVYVRSGTTWSEQAKLKASDGVSSDQFGFSAAISGNTAVVGATQPVICTFTCSGGAGKAYVYVRSGTTWSEQAKLKASDGVSSDQFGSAVAISGNTLVVGAPQPGPCTILVGCGSGGAGKAYVYVRSGTTWSEQAKLTATDGAADDFFGNPVAISGDIVVVGAQTHDTGGKANAGQAYVYARSGTTWSEQAKLAASDGAAGDEFGWSAAVSGNTVVVGAPGHAGTIGQTYVYVPGAGVPEISVTSLSLSFGKVAVGLASPLQGVTVGNDGTASLTLGVITLQGANLDQFKKPASKDLCSGKTIAPTGSCTVEVGFRPTNGGPQSALLVIPSNDADENPVTVTLSGKGKGPEITAAPVALDFGNWLVGSKSSLRTVTVQNIGKGSLTIGAITKEGANSDQYKKPAAKDLCSGKTLAPTDSCTVSVRFGPTNGGPKSATLDIPSNDFNENPLKISLSGTGTP
jgi:hypothetical protein